MSRVAVLSHFTSLSVVELKENCLSLSNLSFSIRFVVCRGFILCAVATFLGHVACRNLLWQGLTNQLSFDLVTQSFLLTERVTCGRLRPPAEKKVCWFVPGFDTLHKVASLLRARHAFFGSSPTNVGYERVTSPEIVG